MSYETTVHGRLWTHSASGKGGRKEAVKKGVWVIDHRDSGKFIIGSSSDVSKEVDRQITLLSKGKHPIKALQSQWDQEIQRSDKPVTTAALQITEYPITSDRGIKLALEEIRASNTAPYCLLN